MLSIRLLAACLIATLPALAQPPARNASSITAAHIHLNSADPDAAIAFWLETIGTSTSNRESLNGVSMMGATILFTKKTPSGPSVGSIIDHLAFNVQDLQPFVDRLKKTSYKSFRPPSAQDRLMIDGPDGVRIELIEDNSLYTPLEFNRLHFHSAQPKEMQAWYVTNLGARQARDGDLDSIVIPGANITLTRSDTAAPSSERAIDRVGFETKELEALCRKLTENGVKLDSPPHPVPEIKASVALLTDPWGTRIELIEKTAP